MGSAKTALSAGIVLLLRSPARSLVLFVRHVCHVPARYVLAVGVMYATMFLCIGPLTQKSFLQAMNSAGIDTLTPGNVNTLLGQPVPLLLVLGSVALVVATTFVAGATLFAIADLQLSNAAPSLIIVRKKVLAALKTMFHIESVLLAVIMCVLAPLAGFSLFAPLTAGVAVPPFIGREFVKTGLGALGWYVAAAVLLYVYFRASLTLPISVATGKRPARSFLDSLSATSKGGAGFAVLLGAAFALTWLISRLAAEFLGGAVDLLSPALPTAALQAGATAGANFVAVASATLFAFIFVARARETAGLPIEWVHPTESRRPARPARSLRGFAALSALAGAAFIATASPALAVTDGGAIVIAHRGYDTGGVENTIGALEAAAVFEPDYVEVDIQQTADGGFVASHDTNLLILAGENKNIYDMTTAQVTSTTVRMKGNSDKIPTMTDYVVRAKELGIPLLIEPKVSGHEQPGFVADLLRELEGIDALQQNIYHSLSWSVVSEIRARNPELRVGLTVGMSYGDPQNIDCDFYTLEQGSYTSEFVRAAHATGREVYVWTVNGELGMRRFLRDGADGLVTDRLPEAEHYRDRTWSGEGYVPGDALDRLLSEDPWR
jgi:glycerophosphoryl diester phosphodiesterase